MNAYIVVEGRRTEPKVIPAWLEILAPHLTRVKNISDITDHNYYFFSSNGIPAIYNHIANAAADINRFNSDHKGTKQIDWLIVNIDTEEETREAILGHIQEAFRENGIETLTCQLAVFEQKVSIETWFLANRKVFKHNPSDPELNRYIAHYNVKESDPEEMENISTDEFSNRAQFHHEYLRKIFAERNITYTKKNPGEVCKRHYLKQLINRHADTSHIPSFARWLRFVTTALK